MSARDLVPTAPARLGRFELRRILGAGAQATVWLAYDARLEREVAIKLMRPGAESADEGASHAQWLQEARSVSPLNHPHIVPVFEADVHDDQPYLVFEYVPGCTLSQSLRTRKSPLPAREAVALLLGVLDALQAAHAAGIVHRDLKPSNILVDASGRARVMDFGIAARTSANALASGVARRLVGTPGYMSPEAARGEAPSPAMDIYAVGMVLGEMLAGRPLLIEADAYRAVQRATNEDVTLPSTLAPDVDDRLRAHLLRAVARDASQRWPTAAALRDALQAWLTPGNAGVEAGGTGALDFLLRRMRHKSDFPALSDAVMRIQRVAGSDSESLGSLSAEILKDVALTHKLLRMVNTAHFAQAGGGSISTVSRAVALVGFAGIRNMALSLVLLEHMQDKLHASSLKEEFLLSLMAGSLAKRLCGGAFDGEEAFIGAMFQNLGRLLTRFYFPEEARQVEHMLADRQAALTEEAASIRVLGMSYEELGLGVARAWGLPESLRRCMRRPRAEPPGAALNHAADRLRWLTAAANDIATTLLRSEPEQAEARMAVVARRYSAVLGIGVQHMMDCAREASEQLALLAPALGLSVPPDAAARRLLDLPGRAAVTPASGPAPPATALDATTVRMDLTLTMSGDAAGGSAAAREQAVGMLVAGIHDITNAMVEDFRLDHILRMVLETMLRALRLRRVVFCLRDAKTDEINGRFGLGEGVETVVPHFKVPMKGCTDLFAVICRNGADTLITDAAAPHIATRLPDWYVRHVHASAFLLLPLAMKGAPFALIYADKAQAGGIELHEQELSMLRTLRNQAVMAFRQAG